MPTPSKSSISDEIASGDELEEVQGFWTTSLLNRDTQTSHRNDFLYQRDLKEFPYWH